MKTPLSQLLGTESQVPWPPGAYKGGAHELHKRAMETFIAGPEQSDDEKSGAVGVPYHTDGRIGRLATHSPFPTGRQAQTEQVRKASLRVA